MTPANIVGMAALKGLDVIALTDHNSSKNCPAAMYHGRQYGVTVIPGMELCTSEEVHVVCLFSSLEKAMDFDAYVYDHMLPVKNRRTFSGASRSWMKRIRKQAEWKTCSSAPPIFPLIRWTASLEPPAASPFPHSGQGFHKPDLQSGFCPSRQPFHLRGAP